MVFRIRARHEDVDVLGHAGVAVRGQRHPADDHVGDAEGVEPLGELMEGVLDLARPRKEPG